MSPQQIGPTMVAKVDKDGDWTIRRPWGGQPFAYAEWEEKQRIYLLFPTNREPLLADELQSLARFLDQRTIVRRTAK